MFKQDLSQDSRVDLTLKQINKRNHSIKFNILTTSQKKKKDVREKQQKQDRELTVASVMNCLLPNSDVH